ncbi:flippase-like domain-containing protein [Pseudenhygromyxa sp. WMMC2535]|uniref:lysylphosphatidylglycerol synthase transmembrane domain-containing protein n=1 Tax=Pseudenhygromyxa sp. WMMC2535 TaxID=2712867 RepID=UPI0015545992|nr:lysylphosphatidylglycerol synthase transmembrane domain-containing protein [Pseudenhygromyxa sp. WMMC2535]NVB42193.1 flippase-like domain-containing protein [Pseudenhygromyxa sp. WMMC2535]
MTESTSAARRQWLFRLALSVIIGGGFVFALIRRIQFIPDDPWPPAWVLPTYLLTLVGYFVFRAGRWHALVRPLADVPLRTTLAVSMAGTMWIMVLPLRLGEFARPLFLAERSEVSFGQGLGTVAIERIVDGLVVCGLFYASLPLLPEVHGEQAVAVERLRSVGLIASSGLFAALLVLLGMALAPRVVGRLVALTLGKLLPSLAEKLEGFARGVAEGLAALPSLGPLLRFLAGTAAYWGFNALGTWLLARGCGLDLGFPEAMAIMSVLGMSLLLPGGPGQLGIFHTGLLLGLSMFVSQATIHARGSVFIFWMFVTQLSMGVLLGVIAQRSLDLDWRALMGLRAPTPTEPKPEPEDHGA